MITSWSGIQTTMAVSTPSMYHRNTYGYPTLFFTTSELTYYYWIRDTTLELSIRASFAADGITRQYRSRNTWLLARAISVRHREAAILHQDFSVYFRKAPPGSGYSSGAFSRRVFWKSTARKRAGAVTNPTFSTSRNRTCSPVAAGTLLRGGF